MTGADIVQVSVSPQAIRDGTGVGYTVPQAKANPVASLLSTEAAGGKVKASFVRPFASQGGVTLAAGGFVWMVAAYKSGSADFNAKHSNANAVSTTRISLFGGEAESVQYSSSSSSSNAASGGGGGGGGGGGNGGGGGWVGGGLNAVEDGDEGGELEDSSAPSSALSVLVVAFVIMCAAGL